MDKLKEVKGGSEKRWSGWGVSGEWVGSGWGVSGERVGKVEKTEMWQT